ncbi:hypothetical protein D9M68_991860 [compost metagenome]
MDGRIGKIDPNHARGSERIGQDPGSVTLGTTPVTDRQAVVANCRLEPCRHMRDGKLAKEARLFASGRFGPIALKAIVPITLAVDFRVHHRWPLFAN